MKVGKSLKALLVLSLLPLGFSTAADAQTASNEFLNETIAVTSPAAGATLNIADNDVTVQIDFNMFTVGEKAITAHVGLASTTNTAAELTTLNAAATGRILDDDSDAGEEAALEGVLAAISAASTMPTHALGAGTEGRVLATVVIPSWDGGYSAALSSGNVTAATTSRTGFDTGSLSVTLSVGSDAGTEENIVAFAVLQSVTDTKYSTLIFSPVAGAFDGDWDGPEIGTATVDATLAAAGGSDPALVTGGTAASLAPVKVGDVLTASVTATGDTQTDLFLDNTMTAQVRITLDSGQGDDIVLPVDPVADRTADGSAAEVSYTFTAADFLDADGNGTDVADEVQVVAGIELIDENGNPTAAETGLTIAAGNADITVAGNTDAAVFSGSASAAAQTAFDNTVPVLAFAASPGVLPASDGTISDGALNLGDAAIPSDGYGNAAIDIDSDGTDDIDAVANAGLIQYENEEAWGSLTINFNDGADVDTDVTIANTGNSLASAALDAAAADEIRFVDISDPAAIAVTTDFDANGDRALTGGDTSSATFSGATTSGPGMYTVPSGSYTVTFQATDLAGNASNVVTATDVWVDVEDPDFESYAPPATETTVNATTVNPGYILSEDLSVLELTISTADAASATADADAPHLVYVSGSLLTAGTEHVLPVAENLVDDAVYTFSWRGRDLAGNWISYVDPVNRTYDEEYEEAIIAKFAVTLDATALTAGDANGATIQAQASDDRGAGTFEGTATLALTCSDLQTDSCADCDAEAFPDCSGVSITGDGVTDNGDGTWALDDGWDSLGGRDIAIANDTATIGFTLTATASDDDGDYTGTSAEAVYSPGAYDHLNLWAGEATAGSAFAVDVAAVDELDNIRWEDERLVNLSANRPAELPGSVLLLGGTGTVWATASAGELDILAVDAIALNGAQTANGENYLTANLSVTVGEGSGPMDPTAVVAYDWPDDQGGFIVVSSAGLDAGSTYQISREVTVRDGFDDDGNLVVLDNGEMGWITWATFIATGADPQRVVVATLDNNDSFRGVGGIMTEVAAKQAFDGQATVSSPYELMTQTMVESKKLAQLDPSIPVFAELTPDALSFIDGSIAPSFKHGGAVESGMTIIAERVRAIDNIAPEPVAMINAFDTPGDRGSSITVTWVKSESDGLVTRTASGAVGPENSDTVMGVKGYNIYRSANGGEQSMVGKVAPGVVSFVDNTALNGLRYHYSVVPYDDDNLATSELVGSAMSIRNIAFDSKGVAIQGLFGADNQVGFDDFFIFADNFGRVGGSNGFDSAFDLNPDNQINFFDFFVFADNFGKVAVGASKVVPLAAGLNDNARIDLAADALPRVGEEMVVSVNLADFAELKGYGFSVSYDPSTFEFVRIEALDERFGAAEIAQPQVVADGDGELSIVAYGDMLVDGELMLDLVMRPMMETENGLIEISQGQLADGSLGFNQIASLGAIAVETRPEEFALRNNYPNPFNPSTTIKYQLPDAGDVRLEIFNVVGQSVRTLVDQQEGAGRYEMQWDATNNNGQSLSSGVYFYRLQAGEFQEVKKMLLMK